jgi:hypothetical protein
MNRVNMSSGIAFVAFDSDEGACFLLQESDRLTDSFGISFGANACYRHQKKARTANHMDNIIQSAPSCIWSIPASNGLYPKLAGCKPQYYHNSYSQT